MSNIVKWALLAAGTVLIIGLILVLLFNDFINLSEFSAGLTSIVSIVGDYFIQARGLINNFFTPFGRTCLTGLLVYLFSKFFITLAIKITVWVYHFVFRG